MASTPLPEIRTGTPAPSPGERSSPSEGARTSAWRPHEQSIDADAGHASSRQTFDQRGSNARDAGGSPLPASSSAPPALSLTQDVGTSLLGLQLLPIELLLAESSVADEALVRGSGVDASIAGGIVGNGATALHQRTGEQVIGAMRDPGGAAGAELALRAANAGLRLIERGLQALLQQRGGELIMRLSPPELGVLEIRMRWEAGRIEVLFRASTAQARGLLDGNLGMLRQSLERHGVGVGRLVVEPPSLPATEESVAMEVGQSFDAAGRESRGRQEAERELRWRTEADLVFGRALRPVSAIGATAAEGPPPCSPPRPAPPARSSPAASAS